jgi:hypothetical protein
MDRKVWIVGGAVLMLILAGRALMYKSYRNRYGKRLVLLRVLFAKFQAMQKALAYKGIDIEMTDAWRGEADQNAAYHGGYSKALFGMSAHNFGAAFDVAPLIGGSLTWTAPDYVWTQIAEAGKAQGLTWGGDFSSIVDKPHFEMKGWKSQDLVLLKTAPNGVA